MKLLTLIYLLVSVSCCSLAINKDSLWSVWNNSETPDTLKLQAMSKLAKQGYVFTDPDSSILCGELLFNEATKTNSIKYQADARNTQGIAYAIQGQFSFAIQKYMEALKFFEKSKNEGGQASTLNNIGVLYSDMGDLDKSLDHYERSLAIKEKLGDSLGMASTINNIGVIYKGKNDFEKALEYYQRCYNIENRLGKESNLCSTLNNIAVAYKNLGNLQLAEEKALQSLSIGIKYDLPWDLATSNNILAIISFEKKDFNKSVNYAKKAIENANKFNGKNELMEAEFNLFKAYRNLGNYKQALESYELHVTLKEELASEENQKEIIRQELKYDYEKQAIADSTKNAEEKKVQEAELAAEVAENKRQKQQSYFLYSGLVLLGLFGIFIFNRFRITRKQKDVIATQKETVDQAFAELEEKNTEILDSINYAKRIQKAILPPNSLLEASLPEHFVLYQPKDIVAGDFYWMEKTGDSVLFAAADCTGHGVPGAMVSVICNNGLNRSVREFGLTKPGEILDQTRNLVIQEFEKSDEEVKDGMDIALCSLSGLTLKFAGAHNPLWIVRNGEILETKADKQPIGKFIDQKPFKTHQKNLQKGDQIYLFSDGFVDQFGGEKGKKFKPKALRELILSVENQPMLEQKNKMINAFEAWKGSFEQIDDVCVIGVRV